MKPVFADTVYYLAVTNPRNQYAALAAAFTAGFSGAFVTTAWVMTEVANSLTRGPDRACFLTRTTIWPTIIASRSYRPTRICSSKGSSCTHNAPTRSGR